MSTPRLRRGPSGPPRYPLRHGRKDVHAVAFLASAPTQPRSERPGRNAVARRANRPPCQAVAIVFWSLALFAWAVSAAPALAYLPPPSPSIATFVVWRVTCRRRRPSTCKTSIPDTPPVSMPASIRGFDDQASGHGSDLEQLETGRFDLNRRVTLEPEDKDADRRPAMRATAARLLRLRAHGSR